jgi:eukaryotic-like serine/threonine-protein kinase
MEPASPERWSEIERLLDRALDLAPEARAAFVAETCSGDPELRTAVERLLHASEAADSLLAEPGPD